MSLYGVIGYHVSYDSQLPHIRKHLCPILWQLWFICHKFILYKGWYITFKISLIALVGFDLLMYCYWGQSMINQSIELISHIHARYSWTVLFMEYYDEQDILMELGRNNTMLNI